MHRLRPISENHKEGCPSSGHKAETKTTTESQFANCEPQHSWDRRALNLEKKFANAEQKESEESLILGDKEAFGRIFFFRGLGNLWLNKIREHMEIEYVNVLENTAVQL
ncbi:hypothetical protein Nepgr_016767 [Nepenthes gracilis]|uniref:Uncharacterized protein n=1 Tax=Nepenthes gracilis TaxID=150966 RepID=A0AAD3XSN1_NEPGR|nr:hypothetical protein Nepgr_016767 [Nepenthes gracilis]